MVRAGKAADDMIDTVLPQRVQDASRSVLGATLHAAGAATDLSVAEAPPSKGS
jgi:hypothetical protein